MLSRDLIYNVANKPRNDEQSIAAARATIQNEGRCPDFFIVGAPRCGTTALYSWLATHPDIFMSIIKEPHYFSYDFMSYRQIHTMETYKFLFRKSAPAQLCGEASTSYLFSDVAISSIMQELPRAKIIVMVRRPLSMLRSLHMQKLYSLEENEPSFDKAWLLSEQRAKGLDSPPRCRAPSLLNYRGLGKLGRQVSILQKRVPPEQLHVVVFDDLKSDPASVYRGALEFLGVKPDRRAYFGKVNPKKRHKFPRVAAMMEGRVGRSAKLAAKRCFPSTVMRLSRLMHRVSDKPAQLTDSISPHTLRDMAQELNADTHMLGGLINRNLDHWMIQ